MRNLLVILLLLATFAFEPARADDATPASAPDFSRYPQTEAFKSAISDHTTGAAHLSRTNLLAISAFFGTEKQHVHYEVTEHGSQTDVRMINGVAQSPRERELSPADLKSLRAALHELPAQNAAPPIGRLVVVSFRDGTNWLTRSYDSSLLSKPMGEVYRLVDERFETKKRQ